MGTQERPRSPPTADTPGMARFLVIGGQGAYNSAGRQEKTQHKDRRFIRTWDQSVSVSQVSSRDIKAHPPTLVWRESGVWPLPGTPERQGEGILPSQPLVMVAGEFPCWARWMLKAPVPKRPGTTATTLGNWASLRD